MTLLSSFHYIFHLFLEIRARSTSINNEIQMSCLFRTILHAMTNLEAPNNSDLFSQTILVRLDKEILCFIFLSLFRFSIVND